MPAGPSPLLHFLRVTGDALGTAARTILLQVRGVGTEGDDAHAEPADNVEAIHPLGFVSRHLGGKPEGIGFRVGDQYIVVAVVDKSLAVWTDVERGEARLYGPAEPMARVRVRADGSLDVEAKTSKPVRITTSGGGDIILNGGTKTVARTDDPVVADAALVTWAGQVTTAVNALTPGAIAPPWTGPNVGKVGPGAPNVKA